jgi:preprotein translocase subunit SecF
MLKFSQKTVLIIALLLAALSTHWVYATGVKQQIHFAKGKSAAVIKGAVVRGDRDEYLLSAKANQVMKVHIFSSENNAAIDIYPPGGKASEENALGHAEQENDKKKPAVWQGSLPSSGDYIISVGGTRGNVNYTLEVSITQ